VRNIAGYNKKVRDPFEAGKPIEDPCVATEMASLPKEAPLLVTVPHLVTLTSRPYIGGCRG